MTTPHIDHYRYPTREPAARGLRELALLAPLALALAGCVPADPTGEDPPPSGTALVTGQIRDAVGQAVRGVSVRVPGPSGYYAATTNAEGKYSMRVPVADFEGVSPVVMFAVKDGYRPFYGWYDRLDDGQGYNFSTSGANSLAELELGEYAPTSLATLLHLGDDSFAGAENSRLQVPSAGLDLAFRVTNWTVTLEAVSGSATVFFSGRGIQTSECPGNLLVLITGTGAYTTATPGDSDPAGGFSSYALRFDLPAIQPGDDVYLRTISGTCTNDHDDFELAGVLVRFDP